MIEPNDPQNKDLAALYREASVEQPSAGLDARILAAAHATAAPPKVATPSWVNRWKIPVALAAMVVMTTTITLLVQDEEAGRLDKPEAGAAKQRTPPPATAAPAGPSVPAVAPATPVPAPKPVEARRKEMAPPARDNSAPPPRAEPPASPTEAPAAAKAEAAAPDLPRSLGGEKKATQSAPATDEIRSGPSSGGAIKDQPLLEKSQPQMQMQAAPPPAPKPAPYVAPAPAPMATPARRADSAERDAARTPEQWIADIRRMRQEGRAADAEASLAEFRKRYPYYALPEDLKRP